MAGTTSVLSFGSRRGILVPVFLSLCGFGLLAGVAGCGGGSGSGTTGNPAPSGGVASITVSPSSANVQPNKTQQFTAAGPGGTAAEVFWSVVGTGDGILGFGTISSSGLYTAPPASPNPNTVTIQATSVFNDAISGSASAVIGSAPYHLTGISLSPSTPTVNTNQTQQFIATLEGTGALNSALIWIVDSTIGGNSTSGTISSTGLYTAPQVPGLPIPIVGVEAAVDTTIAAMTQVNVVEGPPEIQQLMPATANASDQIQLIGQNLTGVGTSSIVFFSGPNGVPLPVVANQQGSTPTLLNVIVPLSTVSGPVFVQVQPSGGPPQTSNNIAFTRLPRVRIRATERDLSQGESTVFQSRILSGTGSETLTWTADVGSVTNNGSYSAPASVLSDSFGVVTACITGTQICDQERLGLHSFRITPDMPVVPLGSTVQLQAVQGGNVVGATWQLNGPGSLQANGSYTASTQAINGGGIPIVATFGGISEQVSVAVTGGFNGLVNRVSDYVDENQRPFPLGVWAVDVGIIGNRAYVLATDQIDFALDQEYYWEDVYDISDPTHPLWINAFEPAARGHFMSCNGTTYEFTDSDYSQGEPAPGVIATYDASGSSPVLLSKQISPVFIGLTSYNGCLFTGLTADELGHANVGDPFAVNLMNLQNGTVTYTQYGMPALPPGSFGLDSAASDGSRMYISTSTDIDVYDLTSHPPSLVDSLAVQTSGSALAMVGNLLFDSTVAGYQIESSVYDISSPRPVLVNTLPVGLVMGIDGNQVLTRTYDAGLQVVDVSNPAQPKALGNLFDFIDPGYSAVLSGMHVFTSEGNGGLGVYDVSAGGGLPPSYISVPGSSQVAVSPIFGAAASSSTVYFAIGDAGGPGVVSFDLGTQPATYQGSFSTGTSLTEAVALSNNDLFVGTADSLLVLDVTDPSSPTQLGSVNLGLLSLALSGTSLYGGTFDGRLATFDITQPSNPVQVGSLSLPDVAYEMTVSGSLLLIADVTGGLLVYNIAVPSAPTLLSQLQPSSAVFDVAADGNLALLAAWEGGLVIVDLTNPSQPVVTGQSTLGTDEPYAISVPLNKAYSIAVINKIAYIGVNNFDPYENNGQASIYGFDYTSPAHPRLVSMGAEDYEFIDDGILSLRAIGTKLFAGVEDPLSIELDAGQPRNTINLSFLPASLQSPPIGKVAPGAPRRVSRQPHVVLPKTGEKKLPRELLEPTLQP